MDIPQNVVRYALYYVVYGIGVDILDRKTNLFSKQTGIFAKAYEFPWTDAWSPLHILWGAIASGMNIPMKWYLPLAVANEAIVEQSLCRLSKIYPQIRYARECDSLPHIVTDIAWGLLGYYGWDYFMVANN